MVKYSSQDITFCSSRTCKNTRCDRNRSNIDWSVARLYRSFADFEGTQYCPKQKEVQKDG